MKVKFRECFIGEYHDKSNQICDKCMKGAFSFNITNKCIDCRDELRFEKCFGGANTSLKNGYWRYSNTSREIYKCDN